MQNALLRILAALPDAITAATFLIAWVAPSVFGGEYVNRLMLIMLMEFIVMHSSGFYAGIVAQDKVGRGRRLLMLTGLSCLYLIFIFGFSLAFDSFWPLYAFGWLFASRFLHIWTHPREDGAETAQMLQLWVLSGVTYVLGAIATVLLPLPRFGMTPAFVASLHLVGSGEWVERPQTVLAFGLIYFGVQAWAKYAMSASQSVPAQAGATSSTRPGGSASADAPGGIFASRAAGIRKAIENGDPR